MNRTQVYLKAKQLAELKRISKSTGAPLAELVRRAVDKFLAEYGGGNGKAQKQKRA